MPKSGNSTRMLARARTPSVAFIPRRPTRHVPCFARDRDRIFHSRCFRRLEYKTQVFVNGIADHYRTCLTHTMEMTAVGRTLARTLSVNEDLTECICLAHDLGHSPFGMKANAFLIRSWKSMEALIIIFKAFAASKN